MRFWRTSRSEKCIFAAKHRCEKPRASTRWWTRSTLAARRTATPSRPRSCRSLKRRRSFSSQSDYFGQQASGYLLLSSSTRRSSRSHLLISTIIVEQFGNCSNFFFLEFFQFTEVCCRASSTLPVVLVDRNFRRLHFTFSDLPFSTSTIVVS